MSWEQQSGGSARSSSGGTIYLYFESKEEIYATVLEEGLDILYMLIKDAYQTENDPLANLLAGHDAFMRFHDEYMHHCNVLMLDKMQIGKTLGQSRGSRGNGHKTTPSRRCLRTPQFKDR